MSDSYDLDSDEVMKRAQVLIASGDVHAARLSLKLARNASHDRGDTKSESAYTSLLASTFVITGEQDQALAEYRRAEMLDPENPSQRLVTARQLLRMRRHEEAISICREVASHPKLDSIDRHEALASMGKAFLESDAEQALDHLNAARTVAESASIPTSLWDHMLAEELARRGDLRAVEYLRALQVRAVAHGDHGTASIVAGVLDELETR